MIQTIDEVTTYYAQPGPMTDPKNYAHLFEDLPADVAHLVRIVQGLAVHIFWAERYGLHLTPQRQTEVNLRPVTQKLARMLEMDPRPLNEPRPLEKRLVCNCRDFSTLMVAILRYQGVPARARCGFGTYFMPGHYEDHWGVEYWKASEARWVMVDAQLDDFQKEVLGIRFDTLDMPAGKFVVAGEAWNLCREKKANPKDFGIFKWHGLGFIRGNVFREVLSFNKIELLPWDSWGMMAKPVSRCSHAEREQLNCAADLSAQGSPDLRAFYADNPGFHVPLEMI
jgi:Transglutaminase-like superfamily